MGNDAYTPYFTDCYRKGYLALLGSQYVEAFHYFTECRKERETHPGVMFNLALCHRKAGEADTAFTILQRTLSEIRRGVFCPQTRMPSTTIDALLAVEALEDHYAKPMSLDACSLFRDSMTDRVLRVLIDLALELQLWNRVIELSGSVLHKNYANVARALQVAKEMGGSNANG